MLQVLRSSLSVIWTIIDRSRRVVLNLLFILAIVFGLALWLGLDAPRQIEQGSLLVLQPRGVVVEQFATTPSDRLISRLFDDAVTETLHRDLLIAVYQAAEDPRIGGLVIRPDDMLDIGYAQLEELSRAIDRFRETGKPIFAYADMMNQKQYWLASLADTIWLDPNGVVLIEGLATLRSYFADLLRTLKIDVHLFRAGDYKSAAEPYVRDDMSPEARLSNRVWLGSLWQNYLEEVSIRRAIPIDQLVELVNGFSQALITNQGDTAAWALENGLVDELLTSAQARDRFESLAGTSTLGQVDAVDYSYTAASAIPDAGALVAVIVAQGPIMSGEREPGAIGGETVSRMLREAADSGEFDALVLRIDSPGGTVLPSEQIRSEVERIRGMNLPVVVSMGSVAASGGYWIAMSGDQIYANPMTITGSIGVYGLFLRVPRALESIGIHTDGVATAELADAFRADLPLEPSLAAALQAIVEDGYGDFLSAVATARGLHYDEVDEIAGGRVWSGEQALAIGLVDRLGGINDAVIGAAELAGFDSVRAVRFLEAPVSWWDQLLSSLVAQSPVTRLAAQLPAELRLLREMVPRQLSLQSYCFCRL